MSGTSDLCSSILALKKGVSEAIRLDEKELNEDAYRKYLECVLRVSTSLLKNLHLDGGHVFVTEDVQKMVKLGQHCMERVVVIMQERLVKSPQAKPSAFMTLPTSGPGQAKAQSCSNIPLSKTILTPISRTITQMPREHLSTLPLEASLVDSLSSVSSGYSSLSSRSTTTESGKPRQSTGEVSLRKSLGPIEMATRHNKQLWIAFKARQSQTKNKKTSTDLSLTIQRKMAENIAIAKAQEQALAKKMLERQQRLEEQAARRFNAPIGLSKEEQYQRQVYKRVLEFEQEESWTLQLRTKFEGNPKDIDIISELITSILRCKTHPLAEQLKLLQDKVLHKIYSIVVGKIDQVNNIRVPIAPEYIEKLQGFLEVNKLFDNVKSKVVSDSLGQSEITLHSFCNSEDQLNIRSQCDIEDASCRESYLSKMQVTESIDKAKDIKQADSEMHYEELNIRTSDSNAGITNLSSNTTFRDFYSVVKEDIGDAITKSRQMITNLELEDRNLRALTKHSTEDYDRYNQENMGDLFDDGSDDIETDYNTEEISEEKTHEINDEGQAKKDLVYNKTRESFGNNKPEVFTDAKINKIGTNNETDCKDNDQVQIRDGEIVVNNSNPKNDLTEKSKDNISTKDTQPSTSYDYLKKNSSCENLENKIFKLKNETYYSHLQGMNEDILTSIDKLKVLFVIVFEQLGSAEGSDQCNVLLEDFFFKPLWNYLLVLFRLANEPKEVALASVMTNNQTCSPDVFSVSEKLCLVPLPGSHEYPYESVVNEVTGIINCTTMLEKLDCLVRASKQVMQCVEQYYKQIDSDVPSIGADDLLPILCYIIVRTRLPQLVSECHAIERFIHEGYMYGEDGYCLTSFQTALNFLISEGMNLLQL